MDMYVCSPTHHFKNLQIIEAVMQRFKQLGGKLPPQLEGALAAAKSGRDIEDRLNVVCDETLKFYLDAENRCAVKAGFKSIADMESRRPSEWSEIETNFDPCYAAVERQYQYQSVKTFFDPKANKELFLKLFKDLKPLLMQYGKKKLIEAAGNRDR